MSKTLSAQLFFFIRGRGNKSEQRKGHVLLSKAWQEQKFKMLNSVPRGQQHLIKPWQITSQTFSSDTSAVSQHDSLDPVRRHLWSYAHVANNTAFVDLMKIRHHLLHLPSAARTPTETTHWLSNCTAVLASWGNRRCNLEIKSVWCHQGWFKLSLACNEIEALAN